MSRYLLCTDLDRTLIPNGAQPESPGARTLFRRLVEREDVRLAYVSGRHRALIRQAIAEYDLPQPDFAITDVGTSIYRVTQGEWQHWPAWDEAIAADWHGCGWDELARLLGVFADLRLQEASKQARHKLSFYADPAAGTELLLTQVRQCLVQQGVRARLVWSVDEAAQVGLLDVLPASAGKLQAIEFLMRHAGYGGPDTLFAGDSGNDLDVLASGLQAVLVANASPELKQQVAHVHKSSLFVAQGGLLGMNGNYSAGILEGAAYFWPGIGAWLLENKQEGT